MSSKRMIQYGLLGIAVILIIVAQFYAAGADVCYLAAMVIIGATLIWHGWDAQKNENKKIFGFMLMFLALLTLVLAYMMYLEPMLKRFLS